MTGLETTFYVIAIIFMSLMLLIGVTIVAAILVIRAKVVAIQNRVEERLNTAQEWAEKGEAVFGAIKKVAHKK